MLATLACGVRGATCDVRIPSMIAGGWTSVRNEGAPGIEGRSSAPRTPHLAPRTAVCAVMPEPGGRFAPSTTGPAHPGTLLAGLLCWLDARSRGARVILRLEDLDPERCRPEFSRAMIDDLAWLGLEWDAVEHQHANRARHEAALDRLAELGVLYPSATSRRELEQAGRRAPDGGWAYDNRDRGTPL